MGLRVVYVMTHDSIGLGEDGPTHQPIEQLASLRAMPNLCVFRPADAVETLECWQCALEQRERPSVLALSRQNLPALRVEDGAENLCARGAYVLRPAEGGEARVRLFATGSEVALAVAARDELQKDGIPTAVVSLPCWELFAEQPQEYRDSVLGRDCVRVAVEAASPFGWERIVGTEGAVIGLTRFGASAPYEELYRQFGLTPGAIVAAAKARLQD
jgi:transketolase